MAREEKYHGLPTTYIMYVAESSMPKFWQTATTPRYPQKFSLLNKIPHYMLRLANLILIAFLLLPLLLRRSSSIGEADGLLTLWLVLVGYLYIILFLLSFDRVFLGQCNRGTCTIRNNLQLVLHACAAKLIATTQRFGTQSTHHRLTKNSQPNDDPSDVTRLPIVHAQILSLSHVYTTILHTMYADW